MKKAPKKGSGFEKYERDLILTGLFLFIMASVVSFVFFLPRLYDFYDIVYTKGDNSKTDYAKNNAISNNSQTDYSTGIKSFDSNNYSLALKHFIRAVESEPDNVDYLTDLAITHYRLKNYDEAIKTYNQIINLEKDNAFVHNNIGNIYWTKRDLEKAKAYFYKAIELNPSLVVSYSNLALMLNENGEREEAIKVLDFGIEKNPESVELKNVRKTVKEISATVK